VARALSLERIYGELRIADFDELELSNLNRIASTVYNIGINKTELLAREIAELDPYLKVVCYDEGVTKGNVEEFIDGLDILIDECDSLDIKILLREKASAKGIPVIMETSDRGMLDIERYDENPEAPILHGLVAGLDSTKLNGLSNEEKIPYVMSILDAENISDRLKESMTEIGKSISTWPQLGSDVTHGGGSTTIAARKILLNEDVKSGRYYIDPAHILTKK
jgi:molybdopterin/thiamine biosynthesis adenylyltransferase